MMRNKEYFNGVIGQARAKKQLSYFIDNYNSTNTLPHLSLIAPKGSGKTFLAEKVAQNLKEAGKTTHKPYEIVNCATIKSLKAFCTKFLVEKVWRRDVTIIFDESAELPKPIEMALLTILQPNDSSMTRFSYEDYDFEFDFRRQSFIFATTEAQDVFHALMDRTRRVDLQEYNYSQLADIVKLKLKGIEWEGKVLEKIASTLRGNARQADNMARDIIFPHLKKSKSKKFGLKDWEAIQKEMEIYPLGLCPQEILVLRTLKANGNCSLQKLAATLQVQRQTVQKDYELYLQKMNLMEIDGQRKITNAGVKYLEAFNKLQKKFKWENV
jgi:Holliday junction resolvasome RuvABC ATP-dependent DNA helicase subunit